MAALPLLIPFLWLSPSALLLAAVLASVVGIYLCGKTASDMQVHDHGSIVWDEVAGILLTFVWVPLTPVTVIGGFLLFRFYDILKPWPIKPIDKYIHGGFGIMLDDIVAGVMACLSLHALMLLL